MNCPHCKQGVVEVNGATVVDLIDVELENGQEFRIIKVQKERKHAHKHAVRVNRQKATKLPARHPPVSALSANISKEEEQAEVPVLQAGAR